MDKAARTFLDKLLDWQMIAIKDQYIKTTGFLDLNEQSLAKNHLKGYGTEWFFYGGYDLAERQIICFLPEYLQIQEVQKNFWQDNGCPVDLLQICSNHTKFSKTLGHRDYLGALVNLGIDRSVIGDIIVGETDAYVFALKHIVPFINQQLIKVSNQNVTVLSNVALSSISINKTFKEINTTVASLRLDNIIKAIFHLSRTNSVLYISTKKVFLNHQLCLKNDGIVKEGDILTVRGIGKCQLTTIGNITKKDRICITGHIYQ